MADDQPIRDNRGLVGLATTVVQGLPPSFLGLLVINMLFVAGLLLFIDRQQDGRLQVFLKIVDACIIDLDKRAR